MNTNTKIIKTKQKQKQQIENRKKIYIAIYICIYKCIYIYVYIYIYIYPLRSRVGKMGGRRLKRRDQAGLPQPDRASLLASAGGARDTHAARETMAAGASFFAFLSHIACSWYKGRISHKAAMGPSTRNG